MSGTQVNGNQVEGVYIWRSKGFGALGYRRVKASLSIGEALSRRAAHVFVVFKNVCMWTVSF